ncbi:DegT/DnrJ/EryC1/StrS family aminotransferase [Clostridium estertheticum]|uniref:DegT/DnrJ/EryC1/StrS family aminotransferase n=1 Tax=Clostridium estertheticum TaxID=238834 RepID=UPI001C0BA463|nr:DegT/DnrJ/EryC1/StrS family aminotransferase [Clostridium estertheticum]MBU3175928.1 DegT/DnrJ/EryC1/StrS family aminotransferase [Clostridium estertheticum]
MKVKFYTPVREYHEKKSEFDSAVLAVMEKGEFILGEEVLQLEKRVEEFTGAKYAIGVASGSDALTITADILGFKNGKEIITSPFTFFASVSCITRNGAKPVFVDIDEDTFNIDTGAIEEKITENTVGILPIHLFSQMANMDKIMEVSKKYNLKVLEDAAEAYGMRWTGDGEFARHSGTIGDFGIFSFFPTKTLGAYGDGGMIVTNSENLYNIAKSYRVHGATKKYHHKYVGYNSRLHTMQAAILLVKMKYIQESIEKRAIIAKWYDERLSNVESIKIPKIKFNQQPAFYVYNILSEKRDELASYLKENGVQTSIYYPRPLHLQECFQDLGYKKGDFPVAEKISQQILALPIFPQITENEVNYVCECIKKFYK